MIKSFHLLLCNSSFFIIITLLSQNICSLVYKCSPFFLNNILSNAFLVSLSSYQLFSIALWIRIVRINLSFLNWISRIHWFLCFESVLKSNFVSQIVSLPCQISQFCRELQYLYRTTKLMIKKYQGGGLLWPETCRGDFFFFFVHLDLTFKGNHDIQNNFPKQVDQNKPIFISEN